MRFKAYAALALLAAAPTAGADTLALGRTVPTATLESMRGGQKQEIDLSQVRAKLNDNSANFNQTGANIVGSGALTDASGLPLVIQNSGNNVIIQNSTILHLNMN